MMDFDDGEPQTEISVDPKKFYRKLLRFSKVQKSAETNLKKESIHDS